MVATSALELQGDVRDDASDSSASDSDDTARERTERIKQKLQLHKGKDLPKSKDENDKEEEFEEYDFGKERKESLKRKAEELKREYKSMKKDMLTKRKEVDKEPVQEVPKKTEKEDKFKEVKVAHNEELQAYKAKQLEVPKKGASREELTLSLLARFKNKLCSAKQQLGEGESEKSVERDEDDSSDTWLAHELHFEDNVPVLAKDANTKDDDWFEISDPRNALAKRRREASKEQLASKGRRLNPRDKI